MVAEVRPIRTKRDHEAALKEVERLWGAKAGTPEGDRLDVLATLVDAYEAEHYPIDPPDPIEAIKFRMEQQGLTRRDLEEIIGLPGTNLPEYLNKYASEKYLKLGSIFEPDFEAVAAAAPDALVHPWPAHLDHPELRNTGDRHVRAGAARGHHPDQPGACA